MACAVLAFGLAYYLLAPLLSTISTWVVVMLAEDWIRNNVQGAYFASDVELGRGVKRDIVGICRNLCFVGAGFYAGKLTYVDPEFYNPDHAEDNERN